jgi:lipopolysaccharide biosynthesis protein
MEPGVRPNAGATQIALYVHYSATGQISEMVRYQLGLLDQAGFSTVFISMADRIPEADWQAVRQLAALVVQRPNFGLDFGAWRDLLPEVLRRWSVPRELLLANDSILGPIHPLAPAIDAMRAGGDGLFGLTESLQGGPHLQSYMLLARGVPAVTDLMRFVQKLHVSHSKWLLVRMGEVRLSRWMRRRGHRVAALFGYDRLVAAMFADPEERRRLQAVYRRLENFEQLSTDAAITALHRWPLNPTHHLWRVLATRFGYPFLKTELIRRNPAHLLGVTEWQTLVPVDSPCPLGVIEAHLATLEAPDPTDRR